MTYMMTINNEHKVSESPVRVLFFGRSGCEGTSKALSLLKTLGCEITFVKSKGRGEGLPEDIGYWEGDYIFCFRSLFVLPKYLIEKAKIAAVNFHPAPVEYPGSGCLNFALYDNASQYGVTAHIMNEKVDNGAILKCQRFPIMPSDTVDTLLERTHLKLLNLFIDVAVELILGGAKSLEAMISSSNAEKWRGEATKMKDFEKLQVVPLSVTEVELQKIIRATYTENFPPYIDLHGYQFVLKSPIKK
jgi:methionyl-tRNA formyltransferase